MEGPLAQRGAAERAEARVTGVACLALVAEPLFVTIRYWSRILPGFDFW